MGSTEHVEGRIDELRRDGLAYFNVDAAVLGDNFTVAASPLFATILENVLKRTSDIHKEDKTLWDVWLEEKKVVHGLGAASDSLPFQSLAGVSSLDMRFAGHPYPAHSCYDNFDWMTQFGDRDFQYHRLLAEVYALLILEVADEWMLPFDLEVYAAAVQGYVRDLAAYADAHAHAPAAASAATPFRIDPLRDAADLFAQNARAFHDWGRTWAQHFSTNGRYESEEMLRGRLNYNSKMADFETDLLDLEGGVRSPSYLDL